MSAVECVIRDRIQIFTFASLQTAVSNLGGPPRLDATASSADLTAPASAALAPPALAHFADALAAPAPTAALAALALAAPFPTSTPAVTTVVSAPAAPASVVPAAPSSAVTSVAGAQSAASPPSDETEACFQHDADTASVQMSDHRSWSQDMEGPQDGTLTLVYADSSFSMRGGGVDLASLGMEKLFPAMEKSRYVRLLFVNDNMHEHSAMESPQRTDFESFLCSWRSSYRGCTQVWELVLQDVSRLLKVRRVKAGSFIIQCVIITDGMINVGYGNWGTPSGANDLLLEMKRMGIHDVVFNIVGVGQHLRTDVAKVFEEVSKQTGGISSVIRSAEDLPSFQDDFVVKMEEQISGNQAVEAPVVRKSSEKLNAALTRERNFAESGTKVLIVKNGQEQLLAFLMTGLHNKVGAKLSSDDFENVRQEWASNFVSQKV